MLTNEYLKRVYEGLEKRNANAAVRVPGLQ